MKLNYLLRYMISDFLMEQKGRIEELEGQLNKTRSENRRKLMKAQIEIYYQQGLEALSRFEFDCPKSVRDYFLGHRKDKPKFDEISSEMAGAIGRTRKLDSKIVYASIAIAGGILFILYFFGGF